jgi:hypothetical protein
MQPYFESANVNDILSVAQKTTLLNKLRLPPSHAHLSLKEMAWVPFYQDDAQNPTLFRQEFDVTIPNAENVVWPSSVAAGDNPFGIEAVENEPVFTTEEKALLQVGNLDYTGWTENYGIGI